MTGGPVVVGKEELAVLLGVDRWTPTKWRQRNLLPEPDHPPVNGQDAWTVQLIESWAAETGRLPTQGGAQ